MSVTEQAELAPLPSDIIFVLDNSGSMEFEVTEVQERMNDFSEQIAASGVDAHVVLISSYPDNDNGCCIDPPLGSGGCPDSDTNLPEFRHVDQLVRSHNAWNWVIETYPQWADSMREESAVHVVVVSDDEPDWSDDEFDGAFRDLDPNHEGYFHHSVVSHSDCPDSRGIGQPYIDLSNRTGGVAADLCDQDFQAVFDALTTAVLEGTEVACNFEIPPPPAGETLDPDRVNVELGPASGSLETLPRVDRALGCFPLVNGWFYDDPDDPERIFLCGRPCSSVRSYDDGLVNIAFGCETVVAG